MNLKIDLNSITLDEGKIFGNVYFENENFEFPEKDWNDFVVTILNWWSESLLQLIKNETISNELMFMDGPLTIRIDFLDENTFKLYFINNSHIVDDSEISVKEFLKNFLKEENALIRFFKEYKWNNKEISLLKENYIKLLEAYKNINLQSN